MRYPGKWACPWGWQRGWRWAGNVSARLLRFDERQSAGDTSVPSLDCPSPSRYLGTQIQTGWGFGRLRKKGHFDRFFNVNPGCAAESNKCPREWPLAQYTALKGVNNELVRSTKTAHSCLAKKQIRWVARMHGSSCSTLPSLRPSAHEYPNYVKRQRKTKRSSSSSILSRQAKGKQKLWDANFPEFITFTTEA